MVTACVKVLDAPRGQHTMCTNFWTELASTSLDDVCAMAGIFSGCRWFSIWVKTDHGMSKCWDSYEGFVFKAV